VSVKMSANEGLIAPILQFRKEDGGLIYPTGNWTCWYSSENQKKGINTQSTNVVVHYVYKI